MSEGQGGNGGQVEPAASLADEPAGLEDVGDRDQRWRRKADRANEATLDELIERQTRLREAADERIEELIARTRSSTRTIRALSGITFSVGLVLLAVSLAAVVSGRFDVATRLGLGAGGLTSMLGVLFYRPMERINRATSDLAQQETMLRTWSLAVDLELMAADTFDRQTVREAAARLQTASRHLSRSLERYVEEGDAPASPRPASAATDADEQTDGGAVTSKQT